MQHIDRAARPASPRPITATATSGLGQFLKRALDRLIAADTAYRERQKARRLSDHLLRDIGLTRNDIRHGGR